MATSTDFYEEMRAKSGRLKRAAIDAYMIGPRGMSWIVQTWRIDSEYSYQEDSPVGDVKMPIAGSAQRCSRPDPAGNSGGVVSEDGKVIPGKSESEQFDRIRRRIDDALDKWMRLPEHEPIGGVAREFSVVRNSLTVDQAEGSDKILDEDGNAISGVGELLGTFELIQGIVTDMNFMAGSTANAFKNGFLVQIKTVVINLGIVAKDMVLAMVVQYGLWKGVQQDVRSLVDASIQKCEGIKSTPKWKEQLRVLQTVYGIASSFIPAAKVSTVVSAAFTLSDRLVDTSDGSVGLGSYDDVLHQLETALEQLDRTVEELERDIRDNLVAKVLDVMGDLSDSVPYFFNPDDVAWTSDEIGDPDAIKWPDGRVVADLATYLRNVADALDSAPSIAGRCKDQDGEIVSTVVRASNIGLGQCGPGEAVRELNGALYRALGDLAWMIRGGADNLLAAYEWHVNTNNEAMASLNAIAQQIEGGSGITVLKEGAVADAPEPTGDQGWWGAASGDLLRIAERMSGSYGPPVCTAPSEGGSSAGTPTPVETWKVTDPADPLGRVAAAGRGGGK